MKKGTKIGISIGAIALTVVVALVLALSFITTKPLANLADYMKASIYTSSRDDTAYQVSSLLSEEQKKKDKELKELLQDCSYSLIQQIFSGKVETDNEDYVENDNEVVFTQTELTGEGKGLYEKFGADLDLPKLRLTFSEKKERVIGKEKYEFDTVELLIANTYGEIGEIVCVAWDSNVFTVQNEQTADVSFKVFKIHANTTSIYNFIINIEE